MHTEEPDAKKARATVAFAGNTEISMIGSKQPLPGAEVYDASLEGHTLNEASGFASVSAEHVARYTQEGYLVIRGAFSEQQVATYLSNLAHLSGEEDEKYCKACLETSLLQPDMSDGGGQPILQFEAEAAGLPKGERGHLVRKLANFHTFNQVFKTLSKDPSMRRVIGRLISGWTAGDEGVDDDNLDIFQSLALLKPAKVGREKPWHQDAAYFNLALDPARSGNPTAVVGVWTALDPALVENGCMHVLPGSQARGPCWHWQRRDWQICDKDIGKCIAVEMQPGDTMFFSSLLVHGTPPNLSGLTRRAIQWHFVDRHSRRIDKEERLKLFSLDAARKHGVLTDGLDVSC